MTPALPAMILLDRDGVILRHVDPYILQISDVAFLPGSVAAIRRAHRAGCALAVVTNQSPISRGLVSPRFVDQVDEHIRREVGLAAGELPTYRCPHTAEDGCSCRKPSPQMLLEALSRAGVQPSAAWMVGDHDTDMIAARAAGIPTRIHVTSGRQEQPSPHATHHLRDLSQAMEQLPDGTRETARGSATGEP